MIAGRFERSIALHERGVQLVGAFQSRAQDWRADAVKGAAACIQHQQPLRSEDPGIKLRKGLGEGASRLVGRGQRLHRVGSSEQFVRLIDQRLNRVVQHQAAHRLRGLGSRRILQPAQFAARRKDDVVDLGKVMVFGGQPEDGGVRPARYRRLARAGQRGSRLEGREERAAEEAHLLAGDYDSRAAAESIERRRLC